MYRGVGSLQSSNLSKGQEESRGPAINQGLRVVFLSASWLLLWAAFYNFFVLEHTSEIVVGAYNTYSRPSSCADMLLHSNLCVCLV